MEVSSSEENQWKNSLLFHPLSPYSFQVHLCLFKENCLHFSYHKAYRNVKIKLSGNI